MNPPRTRIPALRALYDVASDQKDSRSRIILNLRNVLKSGVHARGRACARAGDFDASAKAGRKSANGGGEVRGDALIFDRGERAPVITVESTA